MTHRNRAGFYVIDIVDVRLRGGRLTISSRTKSTPEFRRRDAAVRSLIDQGETTILEALRSREVRIDDVERAVRSGNLDPLRRPAAEADDLSLGQAWDRLIRTVRATRKAQTVHQYETVGRLLFRRFERGTQITQISSDDLAAWIHGPQPHLGGRIWSAARQRLAHAIVARLFKLEIRREAETADRTKTAARIRISPAAGVELPPALARPEFLRPSEWRVLAERTAGTPLAAWCAVGCLSGLRISEAANLRVGIDVELAENPRIRVQPREGEYAWTPKGYPRTLHSVRDIPIGNVPELLAVLRAHIELGFAGERYLFRVPGDDRPPSRQYLMGWTREAFESAGIRYGREGDAISYHGLRHTFISWLVMEDVNLLKISKLAGTSVKMIEKVYGHLTPDNLEITMAAVGRKAAE